MNIIKQIYEAKTKLTPLEVFSSNEFKTSMTEALNSALRDIPRKIRLYFIVDENNTAYTEGKNVTVSLNSCLFKDRELYDQYVSILGLIVHECGHVLFTDFGSWNVMFSGLNKNSTFEWFEKPDHEKADELRELIRNDKKAARYYSQVYHHLCNIFEDQYIEMRCKQMFCGLYSEALVLNNDYDYSLSNSKQTVFASSEPNQLPGQVIYVCQVQAIQQWSKQLKDDGSPLSPEGQKAYEIAEQFWVDIQPYLSVLKSDENGIRRVKAMNEIICCFYDLLVKNNPNPQTDENEEDEPEPDNEEGQNSDQSESDDSESGNSGSSEEDNQSSGSSKSQSSKPTGESGDTDSGNSKDTGDSNNGNDQQNNSISSCDYQKLIELLEKAIDQSGLSKEPRGYSSPININETHISDNVKEMINDVVENIAREKVESDIDKQIQDSLQSEMGLPIKVVRDFSKDSSAYLSCKSSFAGISARTINRLKRVLMERKNSSGGYYLSGKFSSRGYIRASTHENMNMFSRRRHPSKQPDVAFAIRIDLSGSMLGKRLTSAINTALILDEVFSSMNIPYLIFGDMQTLKAVNINLFHRFDDILSNSKYAIANAMAGGGTPEPIGLKYAFSELEKRPEKHKVLISITDGGPTTSSGLFSPDPIYDAKAIVELYRRKGFTVFGAMVDRSDERVISTIYGDQTLNLSDLNILPMTLASLCARFILK